MQLLFKVFNQDWKHIARFKYDPNSWNKKYNIFSRKLRPYNMKLTSTDIKYLGGLKPHKNTD